MTRFAPAGGRIAPNLRAYQGRFHVVQVSRDTDLLGPAPDSEPVQRQIDYARALAVRIPGAVVTIIVLGRDRPTAGWQRGNLFVVSAAASLQGVLHCLRLIHVLHRRTPISVITTQVPYDEAWAALAAGWWFRIPVIGQIHSELFTDHAPTSFVDRAGHALRDWATRRTLASFDALRIVSSESRALIARLAAGIPLATIPVPVPMVMSATRPVAPRDTPPWIVFVGRLAAEKDLVTWLKVAAAVLQLHPRARFGIIGDGPARATLEQEARRLGLGEAISFEGFVPYTSLQEVYARATTLLLTSRAEGFGRVLVEAASQGVPVVSTAVAGPRDIVIHGVTGFLHEPGDLAGLVRSVSLLVTHPRRAAEMGSNARTLVRAKFDPSALRAAWVDLWIATATTGRHAS